MLLKIAGVPLLLLSILTSFYVTSREFVTISTLSLNYVFTNSGEMVYRNEKNQSVPPVLFQDPENKKVNNINNFFIRKISGQPSEMEIITLPGDVDQVEQRNSFLLMKNDGYLTYPDNGNFYIWYPRLGRTVLYFDKNGTLLWEKGSSHYLQAMPGGKFIMALSGDHSRLFFLTPDLDIINSSEGLLFIQYQFNHQDSTDNIKSNDVCYATLNGDFIYANIAQQKKNQIHVNGIIKSIFCDFNKKEVLLQIRKTDSHTDTIVRGHIDDKKEILTSIVEYPLSVEYPFSLPMGLKNGRAFFLVTDKSKTIINVLTSSFTLLESIIIEDDAQSHNVENWKVLDNDYGIVFWNEGNIYLFDEKMFFHGAGKFQQIKSSGSDIFISTDKNIYSLRWENLF